MKTLYQFNINRKVKKEITKDTQDGKLTTFEEVDEPVIIKIKNPSRKDFEEAQCEYQKTWGKLVRAGVLTKALIAKSYDNEGGVLSKDQIELQKTVSKRILEIRDEYKVINDLSVKTDEDNKKIEDLINEFSGLNDILNALDSYINSIFVNSAETSSETRQATWFTFFLTYIELNGKEKILVEGEDLEEKLKNYDSISEDESESSKPRVELYKNALARAGFLINSWMLGKIVNESDFKLLDSQAFPETKAEKEVEAPEVIESKDKIENTKI